MSQAEKPVGFKAENFYNRPPVVGDYAILKGQRKGRFHLEGGVITHIYGAAVTLACDDKLWVMPLASLMPFGSEYKTLRGNELVPMEGADYVEPDNR